MGRKLIEFTTAKGNTAIGEFTGDHIVERPASILVHLRNNEDDPVCTVCGGRATIWFDAEWRHERHPARCTAIESLTRIDQAA